MLTGFTYLICATLHRSCTLDLPCVLYDYFKVLQPAGTRVPTSNINLADFSVDGTSFYLPKCLPVTRECFHLQARVDGVLRFRRKSATCAVFKVQGTGR